MPRRLAPRTPLFALLALLAPSLLPAQGATGDSTRADAARADTVRRGTQERTAPQAAPTPAPPTTAAARVAVGERSRLPAVFYGTLGAGAGVALAIRLDPDPGGYRDGWTTATAFPDKAVHALAAWAITSVGVDLGARPLRAGLAVCAAGTAFEVAQGYVSPYDVAADCLGAAGAAAWHAWRAKRARHRARTRPTPETAAAPAPAR